MNEECKDQAMTYLGVIRRVKERVIDLLARMPAEEKTAAADLFFSTSGGDSIPVVGNEMRALSS